VVTHDMASAFMVADRMAMLSDRRIIATLPREEFRRSSDPAIHSFVHAMSQDPALRASEHPEGVSP